MDPRGVIWRQSLSICLAAAPFGLAFGVVADDAGLSLAQAVGFSTLVFAGSAQFAAVSILADGGSVAAAVIAGVLLNLRSVAFGVVMAPALGGPRWFRALASQLMIDESTAVASGQRELRWQRYAYLVCGIGVFVFWNSATVLGASVLAGSAELVDAAGIDATIPAAFLALIWTRLADPVQRRIAAGGALVAFLLSPVTPAGVPIIAAGAVALLYRDNGGHRGAVR